jgi:hypothetical protein
MRTVELTDYVMVYLFQNLFSIAIKQNPIIIVCVDTNVLWDCSERQATQFQ